MKRIICFLISIAGVFFFQFIGSGCSNRNASTLNSLEPTASSTDFLILDNTVYSSDGKTLYKYGGGAEFVLPDSVLYIAPNAFRGSEITDIRFNDSLIYVGCYAFRGTGITRIDLPDSVRLIDYGAFVDCLAAVEGYIPAGCHSICAFRTEGYGPDERHVAPFYREKYRDSDFPCETVPEEDCLFMRSERDFSLFDSPGSAENAPADWRERYFAQPVLENAIYDCEFQMIDACTGVLIFRSWLNKTGVFMTRDGGVTWEETAAPPPGSGIVCQYAGSIWPDAQTGLLYFYNTTAERFTCAPDEQLVQITTDGGATWRTLYRRDFPSEEIRGGGYFSRGYRAVTFARDGERLRIGFETDAAAWTWESMDGGETWEEVRG